MIRATPDQAAATAGAMVQVASAEGAERIADHSDA
jgi:hypothetical protein